MPYRALKPCKQPGCPKLTHGSFCEPHKKQYLQSLEDRRPSSQERGYDHRWAGYIRRYLRIHKTCVICKRPSQRVDHIVPVRRGGSFWDPSNHQAMCLSCHSRKTATQDGAFGNTPHVFPGASALTMVWPFSELDRNGAEG